MHSIVNNACKTLQSCLYYTFMYQRCEELFTTYYSNKKKIRFLIKFYSILESVNEMHKHRWVVYIIFTFLCLLNWN